RHARYGGDPAGGPALRVPLPRQRRARGPPAQLRLRAPPAALTGVAHRAASAPAPVQVLDPEPRDAHARPRAQVVQVAAALQEVDDAVRLLRAVVQVGADLARLHHAPAIPPGAPVDPLEQSE